VTVLVLQEAFFAPVDKCALTNLIDECQAKRERIEHVAQLIQGENRRAVDYFLRGNRGSYDRAPPAVDEVFKLPGALAVLDADYWQRALELTDVFQCFPEARRKEWLNAIHEHRTPPFTIDAVFPTIEELLLARGKYFAERVDGIWRELSRAHSTNKPTGVTRRIIYNYVFSGGNYVNHSRAGTIHDLRCVIAKFMGREEPKWHVTADDLRRCMRRPGQWHALDGGSLHIKVFFGTGTAHIRLHDDIVVRLNAVLASLYPDAIPASQRTPEQPKAKKKVEVLHRPLPFSVLNFLRELNATRDDAGGSVVNLPYGETEQKFVRSQAGQVLEQIGGVGDGHAYRFDYNPQAVIDEIVLSGVVPDERSHQYYPTPESLGQLVIAQADIGPSDRCLEPSAGQGGLADLMPKERTTCVELSALHCGVLRAKGHTVHHADFIDWAQATAERFDKILMNPPFTAGQAAAHVKAAAGLLAPGGRLVAVMPAGARDKALLPGFTHQWSERIAGEFAATAIAVTVLTLERRP
jgi:hypothetical protein